MARVRAFRAHTFARTVADIDDLTAPPYDVISPEEREALLSKSPHNIVALELPEGSLDPAVPGNRYETGAARWKAWQAEEILVRDAVPTLYVLEQRFTLGEREVRRRAFIVELKLEPFDAGVVLPHERTLPKALGDRLNLTRACAANLSQVLGLYPDSERAADVLFEAVMATEPAMSAVDVDGANSTVWSTTDPATIDALSVALADKQVFIADGHHRYTTALAYRDERRAADAAAGRTPTDPAYDWVMMALVNMDDPNLVVLPTHRVANAPGDFDNDAFYQALSGLFDICDLPPGHPAGALDSLVRPGFLVQARDEARPRLAELRPDVDLDTVIPLPRSRAWKELDVAVLLELVLEPILGIHPDKPETLERLTFVKDVHQALKMTADHDVAFVLRATPMDQLREVALAGDMMPQKSTYFYPKLLSGLVMRGMAED
ncbi:MAG: DUF1015 domain-containing protein [Actinomycetota bacterium]|nr:DUF1015 domain-containing protein [Actinomycetota bacterium]